MRDDGPTAGEVLRQAASLLRRSGFGTPRLDAEVLLGHVTGFSRETLLAHPERPLTAEQARAFEDLLARRLDGCPVAYLVGHKEFMSLDFEVGPAVLIPRPETELLVEVAAELARRRLAAEAPAAPGRPGAAAGLTLADVGTGSGAIAVSLARLLPGSRVFATDISGRALDVARRNAARLGGGSAEIVFRQGDLLDALARDKPRPLLDGVVANLPYVPDAEWERLERNVRDFEPPESLRGGQDGLDLVRRLAGQLPAYLAPGGFVCLEVGPGQAAAVGESLERTGLFPAPSIVTHLDLAGRERVVSAVARQDKIGTDGNSSLHPSR